MTPGSRTSEFALVILILVVGAIIWLHTGEESGKAWLEASWKPVAAYAGARAIVKATGYH